MTKPALTPDSVIIALRQYAQYHGEPDAKPQTVAHAICLAQAVDDWLAAGRCKRQLIDAMTGVLTNELAGIGCMEAAFLMIKMMRMRPLLDAGDGNVGADEAGICCAAASGAEHQRQNAAWTVAYLHCAIELRFPAHMRTAVADACLALAWSFEKRGDYSPVEELTAKLNAETKQAA